MIGLRQRIAWAFLFLFAAVPAQAGIARIDLNGSIDPITAGFVVRSIERAENEKAELFLMRLQTPGGFGSSMEQIIERMLSSKVPVVVYVGPSGAKAASAGFFETFAMACGSEMPSARSGRAKPA